MKPGSDEVSLDINKIMRSIKKRKEKLEVLSGDCCIYTVPPHLRTLNNELYTPQVVSIGPFHHGKEELKAMEEHKQRYLWAFLKRIKKSMEEYIRDLKGLETRLRESYVEINGCNREEFMEMMAIDGAFLMEYLLKYFGYEDWKKNDRIFERQLLNITVRYDLLLIENQLPFFFLDYLFRLFLKAHGVDDDDDDDDDNEGAPSLKIIVQHYLCEASQWNWPDDVEIIRDETKIEHLLHFLIICLQQSGEPTKEKECKSLATPTISELHQAGVKFKPSSSKCLSNIKFSNGVLEIPMLQLSDHEEQLFRNMQAFEQCHNLSERYINDYISIMGMLIRNEMDIKLLVKNGIIDNWLDDNRAATAVFNNLGKGNGIATHAFSYAHVIEDLNAYYKMRRHKWKAALRQKYFNNPWSIISFGAAVFLLLLTIIQTVCSILQVM